VKHSNRAGTGTVLAALLAAGAAHADLPEPDYYSLGVGYVAPDRNRPASHGVGGSAGVGLGLTERLWAEGRVFANVLEAEDGDAEPFGQAGLGLDLLLEPGGAFGGLFALIGGGEARFGPDAHEGASPHANLGLGWRGRRDPDSALRYRVELRAISDSADAGHTDALLAFLVELAPRAPATPVAVASEPLRIVKIERPPPPPPDTDEDGVPDEADRCASTLRGAKVEPDGCVWQEQVVTMSNLRFPTGSDRLTADIRSRLDEVARFFASQPDVVMDVYGHTDAQGSDAYNLKLSKGRAASVRAYLVSQGIGAQRLKSDGFGESRPIADNATEEGRTANRRVDLHIHARQPG
jgi:OOP family OmpA-OmpF porin